MSPSGAGSGRKTECRWIGRDASLSLSLSIAFVALAAIAPHGAHAAAPPAKPKADRDADGLPDKWEKRYGLSLRRKQGGRDQDRDGLGNRDEYRLGTNPRYRDTDNDRLLDGDEVPTGHDPLDRDSDGDGIDDGRENPGRIVLYGDGVLELALSGGDRVLARTDYDPEPADEEPADGGGPTADIGQPADGCDENDLVVGAAVHEADLRLTGGVLVARAIVLRG
jgi:hypothetical protein